MQWLSGACPIKKIKKLKMVYVGDEGSNSFLKILFLWLKHKENLSAENEKTFNIQKIYMDPAYGNIW